RPEDKALVERTTHLLSALELVEPPGPLTALPADSTPITVIPTTAKASVAFPSALAPRRTAPRSLHLSLALWLIAGTLVSSVLYIASPFGGTFTPRPFPPHGAQIGLGSDAFLTAPWAPSSFMAKLDIGGGAGPGVRAPGSAGPPVKPAPQPTPTPKP